LRKRREREVIFDLDVADAEDVRGIDIGAGKPSLDFLERRDRVGRTAGEIKSDAQELDCFAILGISSRAFLDR